MQTDRLTPSAGTRVGFIGTGIMGRPMVRNLIRAGYAVCVHNRTPARYADLVAEGALSAATPGAVAAQSDVTITMLGDWPELEAAVLGAGGVCASLPPGALFIDMGTTAPANARTLAQACRRRGIEALDAPVSGGEAGAIAATLTIMAGGTSAAFARAEPLFRALGTNVTRIGDAGAGQIAKACNQLIVAVTIEAVAEALALARASGVDPERVRSALLGGFATSRILELHGRRMIEGNYLPGGALRAHMKDRAIVTESAARAGLTLPAAQLVFERVRMLVERGDGGLDHAALYTLFEDGRAEPAGAGPATGGTTAAV